MRSMCGMVCGGGVAGRCLFVLHQHICPGSDRAAETKRTASYTTQGGSGVYMRLFLALVVRRRAEPSWCWCGQVKRRDRVLALLATRAVLTALRLKS